MTPSEVVRFPGVRTPGPAPTAQYLRLPENLWEGALRYAVECAGIQVATYLNPAGVLPYDCQDTRALAFHVARDASMGAWSNYAEPEWTHHRAGLQEIIAWGAWNHTECLLAHAGRYNRRRRVLPRAWALALPIHVDPAWWGSWYAGWWLEHVDASFQTPEARAVCEAVAGKLPEPHKQLREVIAKRERWYIQDLRPKGGLCHTHLTSAAAAVLHARYPETRDELRDQPGAYAYVWSLMCAYGAFSGHIPNSDRALDSLKK